MLFIQIGCAKREIPVIPRIDLPEVPDEPVMEVLPEKSEAETSLELARNLETGEDIADSLHLYKKALDAASEEEKNQVVFHLNRFLATLDTPADNSRLSELVESEKELIPRAEIMYRLGLNYASQGDNERSVKTLLGFIQDYPDHPDAENAREIISLLRKHIFKKNTVGCLLPLSGRFSMFGERALRGIELAVQDFSKQYKDKITVVIKDTRSDDDWAVSCIDEFADQKVAGIVGPIITSEAAAICAQNQRIPMIAMTQKSQVAKIGDYIFSNFLTPEIQTQALASYAARVLGVKKFAILYPDDRYGRTYMNLFWDRVEGMGGEIVGAESYSNDQTDFSDAIKKLTGQFYSVPRFLRATQPVAYLDQEQDVHGQTGKEVVVDFTAVFIPDAPSKIGMILPQLAYYDVTGCYLLGTNIWHDETIIDTAKKYATNTIITDGFFAGSANPMARQFADRFRSLYGKDPGFIEAAAYDTLTMLVQTAMESGVNSRSDLRNALAGKRIFEGVTGRTMFDPDGNAQKELVFLTIKNGEFREITP